MTRIEIEEEGPLDPDTLKVIRYKMRKEKEDLNWGKFNRFFEGVKSEQRRCGKEP